MSTCHESRKAVNSRVAQHITIYANTSERSFLFSAPAPECRYYMRGRARGHSVHSFAFLSLLLHCANLDVARTFPCHWTDVFLVPESRDGSLHYMRQLLLQSNKKSLLSLVTAALSAVKEPQRQHLVNLNCLSCAPATGLN